MSSMSLRSKACVYSICTGMHTIYAILGLDIMKLSDCPHCYDWCSMTCVMHVLTCNKVVYSSYIKILPVNCICLYSLAADIILFNSAFNQETFLSSIKPFFNLMPDYKPRNSLVEEIRPKCTVLHFPINFQIPDIHDREQAIKNGPLHIVWAHRWYVMVFL